MLGGRGHKLLNKRSIAAAFCASQLVQVSMAFHDGRRGKKVWFSLMLLDMWKASARNPAPHPVSFAGRNFKHSSSESINQSISNESINQPINQSIMTMPIAVMSIFWATEERKTWKTSCAITPQSCPSVRSTWGRCRLIAMKFILTRFSTYCEVDVS